MTVADRQKAAERKRAMSYFSHNCIVERLASCWYLGRQGCKKEVQEPNPLNPLSFHVYDSSNYTVAS